MGRPPKQADSQANEKQENNQIENTKIAVYKVDAELQKKEGKTLDNYREHFKIATAQYVGQECVIIAFSHNKQTNEVTVVLHAEKQGLRKEVIGL